MNSLKNHILGINEGQEQLLEANLELGTRVKAWLEKHDFKPCSPDLDDMIAATRLDCDRRTGEIVSPAYWYIILKNEHILVTHVYGRNVEHFTEWKKNEKSYTVAKRYGADGYSKTPKELDEIWDKFIKKLV